MSVEQSLSVHSCDCILGSWWKRLCCCMIYKRDSGECGSFGICYFLRGVFVLPVLEYCSAVWCLAANTRLKLLDHIVSGACFSAGGVLNCNLSHHRSVTVLYMLYKIRCGIVWHSTYALCASPGYKRYFDRTLVYLCASPLQNLAVPQDFYSPVSISLEWSGWPCIRWCMIGMFQEQVQCLFVGLVALSFFVFNYFPFLFFSSIGW